MRKHNVKGMLAVSAAMMLALSGMTVCAAEPGTTYTVQAGDSLSKIAKAAYGDAAKWKVIYESNKAVIKNPSVIYKNQQLVLPQDGQAVTDTAKQQAVTDTTEQQAENDTVAQQAAADTTAQQATNDAAAQQITWVTDDAQGTYVIYQSYIDESKFEVQPAAAPGEYAKDEQGRQVIMRIIPAENGYQDIWNANPQKESEWTVSSVTATYTNVTEKIENDGFFDIHIYEYTGGKILSVTPYDFGYGELTDTTAYTAK